MEVRAAAEAKLLREKGQEFFKKTDYPRAVEFLQKSLKIERRFGAMAQFCDARNAAYCSAGECVKSCVPGDYQCFGNIPQADHGLVEDLR